MFRPLWPSSNDKILVLGETAVLISPHLVLFLQSYVYAGVFVDDGPLFTVTEVKPSTDCCSYTADNSCCLCLNVGSQGSVQ
jgi:hypothetical protein